MVGFSRPLREELLPWSHFYSPNILDNPPNIQSGSLLITCHPAYQYSLGIATETHAEVCFTNPMHLSTILSSGQSRLLTTMIFKGCHQSAWLPHCWVSQFPFLHMTGSGRCHATTMSHLFTMKQEPQTLDKVFFIFGRVEGVSWT